MRRILVSLAIGALSVSVAMPARAKEHFQVYEGRDAVQEGQGGTRVTQNGIDYWTTGTPPRRYQVLGVIVDKRCLERICGEAVGSKSVAEVVKASGGDAVIVLSQQQNIRGMAGSGFATGGRNFASGFGWSAPYGDREAMLQVIKYLPETAASAQSQPASQVALPPAATPATANAPHQQK